ncbi:MAG: T9SS type A sorting domain-containing protein [Ignavibacteria bacterium]|nr:T9SS type A sorting domain-containing protein [Ignavibacteria bacterium]
MKKKYSIIILLLAISECIFCQNPVYYPGFPFIVDSSRKQFQKAGTPLITDFENDSQKEIVFFTVDYNGSANPAGMLYVINSNGTNYPNFPKGYDELILDMVSGDVNGDGYNDLAIRLTNSFDVIDRFGNSLPGFPINYSDGDINPLKGINIYDLDSDGLLEIVVSKNEETAVFNSNGVLRNGWPKSYSGICQTNVAIADIDNDGLAEIVVPIISFQNVPKLRIYRSNGENFSSNWPVSYDSSYNNTGASPTLIINKSNTDSTFILMSSYLSISSGYTNNRLTKYDIKGNVIDRGFNIVLNALGTLVIGDVDRDWSPEFCNGNQGNPTSLSLYSNMMEKIPGWPNEGVGQFWATPVIGKLSNSNDLIISDNNWNAFNPKGYGNIFAYNKDGSPLPWSPLRPIGLVNSISLSDINNDGSIEIIATSSQTFNETYLHVWTIPGIPFTYEDFPWPQYGHDRYRTNQHGFIPPDEPVGIQPMNTNVPSSFNLYQNFPNPFNPATSIKFDIAKKGNVKLVVFDILGRELSTLIKESLNPGTYQVSFDGNNLSSGVYFYKLSTDSFTEIKRMIMAK